MGKSQVDGLIIPQDPSPSPGAKIQVQHIQGKMQVQQNGRGQSPRTKPKQQLNGMGGKKATNSSQKRHKVGWGLRPWENKTPPATQYEFTGGEGRAERVQKEDSANCWPVSS